MPIFTYKAKKGPDEVVEGTLEALSEKEAIEKISQLGYLPLSLQSSEKSTKQDQSVTPIKKEGKVRSRHVTLFSRQLAGLLKAGVPILGSLNIIAEQTESRVFSDILKQILKTVKEGNTFSSALAAHPKVFNPLYIAMVRTGENSGVLPEVLMRISEYRAKEEEAMSRFRMALAYPLLMAIVGLGTIVFMLTFVMPRLMKLFGSLGQSLPLPTRMLISFSNLLQQWWLWVICIAVVWFVRRRLASERARKIWSAWVLRLPLFGPYILKAEIARFSRTLELLLKSGITILRAIDVAIPVVSNEIMKEHIQKSLKELEQGGSFGRSLKNSHIFPPFVSNLLLVGEESGKLTDALAEIAASYERDTDEATKTMTNLLEPAMILVMGTIVGFIVIAMLLPIFEINVAVH
ncbi:MAG TPA: type II secretion system F family protein [Candidatus Omnitrophota bacterium]|nr:type II secretion system F family protein [Candidatus Omnitrophota bacterium]HPT07942.1 type II secretion system F family protein [Candidatus Omnitrophota bacterium]